ncbi:hypothetical protein CEQ90_02175 [Lewinellaceae bacterium SD302]|nr:hypothetical protein CEQ90_02175 [Lewinellaceae bacterium SD302]
MSNPLFNKVSFVLLMLTCQLLSAQRGNDNLAPGDRIPLRTLVRLAEPETDIKRLVTEAEIERVSSRYGIYQLNYGNVDNWLADYESLERLPDIATLQFDYRLESRNRPNDEEYERQTNLVSMGFERVWETTTGGTTTTGDQIVVAILDEGFDADHPDLVNSLWRNTGEILGDGIDNDGNGYVDDEYGWDFSRDEPNLRNSMHGTQVAGIIGARGNNGIGVTGTSWNNRLMLFAIDDVTNIIQAYEYVLEQRKRWNDSNGAEGALVVATNASFGLEGQNCSDFPIWGEMYELLGEEGILTAASTANRSWDVDERGDMPTTCPSDYVIGVTNVTDENRLEQGSAWGSTSVDLAAMGQGSFTTILNGYGGFGNTSAAAPYVTGAIALLYSLPCPRINALLRDNPPVAARLVRQSILRTVSEQQSLEQLIATGGVLDVAAAAEDLLATCSASEVEELTISAVYPNPAGASFQLEFGDPALGPYTLEFIDVAGRVVRIDQLGEESALPFSNGISVEDLPRGVYVLRLSNGVEMTQVRVVLQ